jgi:hypothetical protein
VVSTKLPIGAQKAKSNVTNAIAVGDEYNVEEELSEDQRMLLEMENEDILKKFESSHDQVTYVLNPCLLLSLYLTKSNYL